MIIRLMIPLLLLAAGASRPASTSATTEPKTAELKVYPRSVSLLALKYSLLPSQEERQAGNAALLYYQAALNIDPSQGETQLDRYEEMPLAKLPRKEVRKFLNDSGDYYDNATALRDADLAAKCESCDWQWPARRSSRFMVDFQAFARFRHLSGLLSLKARLAMCRGKYDEAAGALREGFDLAHRLGEHGDSLHALTALGIESLMLERVQEWVQQPDAPNLYWALANLPRPFYSIRQIMEYDQAVFVAAEPLFKPMEPQQAPAHMLWKMLYPNFIGLPNGREGPLARLYEHLQMWIEYFPDYFKAREYLRSRGLGPAQIKRLGYSRVMGLYVNHLYQVWSDRWLKWAGLPYWQAQPKLDQLNIPWERFTQRSPCGRLIGLTGVGFQQGLRLVLARTDRQIAVLQTIESLRAYADTHHGQVPDSLEALGDLPAPDDPFTGRPLRYQRTADGFRILTPHDASASGWPGVYHIVLGHAQ